MIIRLAVLALLVNASWAYSACCDSMVEQPAANQQMEIPCHQTGALSDPSFNMDECCVAMMPLISVTNYQAMPVLPASHALLEANSDALLCKLDPLFKPPKSFLL